MLNRHSLAVVALGASVGVPYLSHSSGKVANTASDWWSTKNQPAAVAGPAQPGMPPAGDSMQPGHAPIANLEGATGRNLGEFFRFDVSPAWILSRWPRVSASLAEIDLQGYRVPLVTGTRQDDLAGSLTYYFDKQGQCVRIMFRGTTGDPRRLVSLVTGEHGFVGKVCTDPTVQLYQFMWDGKPHSELTIRPAKIVRHDAPYARFELNLALNRT